MPADPRLKDLLRPILPLVVAAVRAKVRTPGAAFSDWDESKHERAKDGKFGKGGGHHKRSDEGEGDSKKSVASDVPRLERPDIGDDEPVDMHSTDTGEVVWSGTHADAKQLIRDAIDADGPAGVAGLAIKRQSESYQPRSPGPMARQESPASAKLPPPSDYRAFKTGQPIEATVFRGETAGGSGSGMAALGHGRYYGLEPAVASRFSRPGTVQASTVQLKSPAVVRNDEEMIALKKRAEDATGLDFGRTGNNYIGFLHGDQPAAFTRALQDMGYDGIATTYKEAPGGEQIVVFPPKQSYSADFADAPPTDYARYFAADQHGRYPGDLHREFGLGVRQFADHTGLVRKQVRYKLNGQTHERYQWVKPPDAPAAPKQPAPTTTPTAPTTSEKQPGKLSTFASKLAKSPGGRVLIKMGGPAVRLALKVEHKLAVVQAKTQQVAVEAARQRGFSPEQADRLEKLLRLGDFLGGYAAAGAGGAVAGGVGAKVGAMMPTASVAYLMYSTARDPGATWRAAKTVMRRTLGLEKATATHADDTSLEGLAGLLADRLAAADDPDWYAAMVYAGLGLTGDLGRAIDAADGEEVPEDGQRFSDDVETFAGRPGLVQKKIQYTRGGKSYTRMQWVKPPAAPKEKPAKPAKKAKPDAPSKPDPKQVKADAHARVKELLAAETPGPDHAKELHAALSRLTVPEIQALKKERDVKGGKTKADHIAKLLAHVQAVRGKVKSVAGLPGVIQEYQSATGRAKQALENALANANVIDPDKPKRKPKDVPPRDLAIALTSSWLELHRLGNKPDEMAPLERALAHAGLERIGEQGSTESFDGTRHDPGKTATLKGAPVKVIRPGWQMKEPGGTLRLVPAAVEPVTSGAKKPKAASPSPPPTPPTRDTIQEKIKAAKHDPDKQAQIVAGIIRATATDGGFVYTHGMSSPTITKKAVIDGVSFHWEDTPDGITRAARTIVNASAFPQPAKLWEATGRVICTSQRNKDDAHWEKEYGTQGFKASATGGDGTTVVYNNGSGSPSLLAHEAGHNLANKLWGQPSPPEDSEYAKAQKVEPPASEYGANSAAEDFAEAVMKYVTTPLTMEQDFPVKFAAVKKLLEGT